MTSHMGHMALMGLFVSVAAPALLLVVNRLFPRLDRWTAPAAVVLPGFVALHFAVTVCSHHDRLPPLLDTAAQLALIVGATLFWAPVLGHRHRLPDAGRTLYLYTAMPLLDLAGVWLVAVGDSTGGLSMIAGMLPMGLAAAGITWIWIHREERCAVADEPNRTGAACTPGPAGQGANMAWHARPRSSPHPPRDGHR